MTNPYRAMCAELIEAMADDSTGCWQREADVIDRARALLAQPVAESPDAEAIAAAVLEAAADQVVPEEPLYGGDQRWMFERDTRQESRKKLLAIAAELRAQ